MAHDNRPFRERYEEAALAVRRRRAAKILLLLSLLAFLAIVVFALTAPDNAILDRSDKCQHNLAPCSTPR